jgi:hypothetical protein
MQSAPDHLDSLEAGESSDDIGQEAPKLPLVAFLRPGARNAAAAGRAGWSASYGSDPTSLGRYVAVEVLDDRLIDPAHDNRGFRPYPHEANQLFRGLVLPIDGCGHRTVLYATSRSTTRYGLGAKCHRPSA